MFLLGFISKRVINYTSKYNDDDEGHDDIVRYWMRARTVRVSRDTRTVRARHRLYTQSAGLSQNYPNYPISSSKR